MLPYSVKLIWHSNHCCPFQLFQCLILTDRTNTCMHVTYVNVWYIRCRFWRAMLISELAMCPCHLRDMKSSTLQSTNMIAKSNATKQDSFFRYIYPLEYGIISKRPSRVSPIWNTLKPFSPLIWTLMLLVTVGYAIILLILFTWSGQKVDWADVTLGALFSLVREGFNSVANIHVYYCNYYTDWL